MRIVLKMGEQYADGERKWVDKAEDAFVFTDQAAGPQFANGRVWAEEHAKTFTPGFESESARNVLARHGFEPPEGITADEYLRSIHDGEVPTRQEEMPYPVIVIDLDAN